ncbi:MAG: addiction module toxin, HicA family [Dehalococcoidia bacterium]|nr:addiction module toxin, HicA family [Dehalococcoidia bacterium]
MLTAGGLRKVLRKRECVEVSQRGSHLKIRCGECLSIVPVHRGDLGTGLLRSIERDFEACLGKGWLRR